MINNYLKTHREALANGHGKHAFSQVAVAKKLGVSKSYVCRIENGTEKPSREFLVRISQVYGLDTDTTLAVGGFLSAEIADLIAREPRCLSLLHELSQLNVEKLINFMNKFEDNGKVDLIAKIGRGGLRAGIVNRILSLNVVELSDLNSLSFLNDKDLDFD